MVVSQDAPALDVAYKLTEYAGKPRLKTSEHKISLPGRKQIFRAHNRSGGFYADLIALEEEPTTTVTGEFRPAPAQVAPLLEPVFTAGRRIMPRPTLNDARERFMRSFAVFDSRYKQIDQPDTYPVRHSAALNALLISERLRAESRQD
jgi:nicotinate phosphoribosyltransferase